MYIWIVLIEDHHTDVDALPYSTQTQAFTAARKAAPDDAHESALTESMRRDGWALYLPYSPEGDHVRVIQRHMDSE